MARLLVVEDSSDIADLIRHYLDRAGHTVDVLTSGRAVPARVKQSPPDLVILDLMLPGMDGLLVCQALRAEPQDASWPASDDPYFRCLVELAHAWMNGYANEFSFDQKADSDGVPTFDDPIKVRFGAWRPIDGLFRTITARRNPNLILLSVGAIAGRPDLGLVMVALWTLVSLGFHALRLAQAEAARGRGAVPVPWEEA